MRERRLARAAPRPVRSVAAAAPLRLIGQADFAFGCPRNSLIFPRLSRRSPHPTQRAARYATIRLDTISYSIRTRVVPEKEVPIRDPTGISGPAGSILLILLRLSYPALCSVQTCCSPENRVGTKVGTHTAALICQSTRFAIFPPTRFP